MQISRLRVSNEDFIVASMIERCPKAMMLREMVQNAIEGAATATTGEQKVEIAPFLVEGIRKLSIWNTGTGMDADELYRMCDIASSIGKPNALNKNFGMGAKVASLPSNSHGIRYRSCKGGRVHQIVLGKRDGAYGRIHQPGPNGQPADVLEVTEVAMANGRALEFDWTEVVLMGNNADQDTVVDPYNGNPPMPAGWIAQELYERFHTLPSGMCLILKEGCNLAGGDRRFVPIGERNAEFANYEVVPTERGIKLHYFYDASDPEWHGCLLSARGALQPARSAAALIWRDEIYDLRPLWAWLHEAPIYGIPFGARNISIYIQLPDDYPLVPDGYRQFLRHDNDLQSQIYARDFAGLALRHRPNWLLQLLQQLTPDSRHTDQLQGEMAGLFRSLGIRRQWWPPGDGTPPAEGYGPEYEVAPQIVPLRDENDIRERGMENKAARFYPETHQLFINTTYNGFTTFSGMLEQAFATVEDPDEMRMAALTITETMLTRQVCRQLVFALSKREIWHGWEVDQATSMYSLTLAVDDNAGLFEAAKSEMAEQFGDLKSPIDPNVEGARTRFASAMEELLGLGEQQVEVVMRFG